MLFAFIPFQVIAKLAQIEEEGRAAKAAADAQAEAVDKVLKGSAIEAEARWIDDKELPPPDA